MTRTQPPPTVVRSAGGVRAVQANAALSVLALFWLFATAGRVLSGSDAIGAHGAGAIALHVTTFLVLSATLLHARAGGPRWPVACPPPSSSPPSCRPPSGDAGNLTAHVPGALVLTVGTAWVTAWAFRRPAG
jgi:hypothetical protein